MEIKDLKLELERTVADLNKKWSDEVDNNDRKTPMDYIRTSTMEGELNMALRILSMLS